MSGIAPLLAAAIEEAGWRAAPAADPATGEQALAVLRPLYAAGRRDLPLGRLFEGHVDAVHIVQRYGTPAQVARLRGAVAAGATLGVWNAGLPGEPLVLTDGRLRGGKGFASGAGVLSHALVTADTPDGPQLVLLDLARTPPAIDRSWWRTTGMQRSETHLVRWQGAAIAPDDRIGAPHDYAREPFFSGGALRFVAVHAGGVAGLFDLVRNHLVSAGRAEDPVQAARLADLFLLADGAAGAVRAAAGAGGPEAGRLARVAAARCAVTDMAERAIRIAQNAVGVQGFFHDHPLSAMLADFVVYLRQPAPDAQRLRVGAAARDGLIAPAL